MTMPKVGTVFENYLKDGDEYIPCAICGEPICTGMTTQIDKGRRKVTPICEPVEIYAKVVSKARVKISKYRNYVLHARVERRYAHPECHALGFGIARKVKTLKLKPPVTVYHVAHGRLTDIQIARLHIRKE